MEVGKGALMGGCHWRHNCHAMVVRNLEIEYLEIFAQFSTNVVYHTKCKVKPLYYLLLKKVSK